MIALTGIVFSLAFVLQQYLTVTYSPRIVQAMQRGILPHAIGVFTATFIFCLVSLHSVRTDENDPNGSLVLWVALFWLLLSIIMLIFIIVRVGDMSIVRVLFFLEEAGNNAIEKVYKKYSVDSAQISAQNFLPFSNPYSVIYRGSTRYIGDYSIRRLLVLAEKYNAVIQMSHSLGDPITDGDELFIINGGSIPKKDLFCSVIFQWQRFVKNDPRYTLRLLVDVAIRALSPGINDPTTAVQSLDHIESLLKKLGNSNLTIGTILDAKNKVRIIFPAPSWNDYLSLSLLEILQYGKNSLPIERRIGALLFSLKKNVAEQYRPAVELIEKQRLKIIDSLHDDLYRSEAGKVDRQGLGARGLT